MARFFNTAGPCEEGRHYMVPPLGRLPEAMRLVERGHYFVVHAPRQTGKTTFLRSFAVQLTSSGRYVALHFSCETGEVAEDDVVQAQASLLTAFHNAAADDLAPALRPERVRLTGREDADALTFTLRAWAAQQKLPIVLLIDEIDALRGKSLISVLRQLRAGYNSRGPGKFPWSVALCGLRDVRDYKAASGGDPDRLGTSSPFNIKVESLRLGNFDRETVEALYAQHTAESGQLFSGPAIDRAMELSGGQPWLVNALALEVVDKLGVPVDQPIEPVHFDIAKERLIVARQTHLDSLAAKLGEPRVRRVLAPLLSGETIEADLTYSDDVSYVRDLGLIALSAPVRAANPIYREVMVRVLAEQPFDTIQIPPRSFVRADGSLDMRTVMEEFAAFWREQGELFASNVDYHEAACELVLSAWLQRIVNGGGHIERQYGIAWQRMDMLVRWPPSGNLLAPTHLWQREALELKVWRDGRPDPLDKGLTQLEAYLDQLGLVRGWLVIFDRRTTRVAASERTHFTTALTPARGFPIDVLRA